MLSVLPFSSAQERVKRQRSSRKDVSDHHGVALSTGRCSVQSLCCAAVVEAASVFWSLTAAVWSFFRKEDECLRSPLQVWDVLPDARPLVAVACCGFVMVGANVFGRPLLHRNGAADELHDASWGGLAEDSAAYCSAA